VKEMLSAFREIHTAAGSPFDYAQGRLSTPFGWRLAAVRVTAPLITEDSPGGWELTFL